MSLRVCAYHLVAPSLSVMILIGCAPAGQADGGSGGSAQSAGGRFGVGGSAELGGSGGTPPESNVGVISVEGVSTWKGNATAAYTIIHDDACDYTLDSLFKVA